MEEEINVYLKNPDFLYSKWFEKENIVKTGNFENLELTGNLLPISKIKKAFNDWVNENYIKLQRIICCEFKYNEKKDKINNTITFIMLLATCLEDEFKTTYIELATLLFLYGLDKICVKK